MSEMDDLVHALFKVEHPDVSDEHFAKAVELAAPTARAAKAMKRRDERLALICAALSNPYICGDRSKPADNAKTADDIALAVLARLDPEAAQ